jgi:prepilin-type N-terminal cleavage/methylation domain-containing protein
MISKVLKRQQGFTLIEVLVAALVVVIGMTALAGILIGAQNQASADVQESQLINIADRQIEQIRAAVATEGFDSLGVSLPGGEAVSSFMPLSTSTIRSTFLDPERFVEGGCFEIASNYDSVNTSSAPPYGSAPPGFTPWSNCNTQAEPLQTFTSGGIVQWTTSPIPACATGAASNATFPCWLSLGSTCSAAGTYAVGAVPACAVTVYAFVTDTYVGCGTTTGTTTTAGASTGICPTLSGGTVQASSCTTASTTVSSPCADARRVTVAVVPNSTHLSARVTPIYLSTIFANPAPSTSQAGSIGLTAGATL